MPRYLFDDGANLEPCVINNNELHTMGFDVNLESELEDDKGVTLTETAGVRTIPQMSGRKSLTKFTLVFKYGTEPNDFWGRKKPVQEDFEKKRKTLLDIYQLNEPLQIVFKPLNDFGINKMIMLSRSVTTFELYEEVYINCVEYSEAHFKIQSQQTAENWYVNTLDNDDLKNSTEEDLQKYANDKSGD